MVPFELGERISFFAFFEACLPSLPPMIFVQINDLCKEQGLHCHIDSVMTSIELPFHEYCALLARAASSSSSSSSSSFFRLHSG
jgi:hypothetical protein